MIGFPAEGIVVNGSRKIPVSPLHVAILSHAQNYLKIMELLLDNGAQIDSRGQTLDYENGYTPLMFAVRYHILPAVQFLLKHGADPKIRFPNDYTPLRSTQDPEMRALLMQYGATE